MQDIALNDNADILAVNGDWGVQYSDPNHIRDIVQSYVGNWKEYPTCGVGIFNFVGSNGQEAALTALVQAQLQQDGFINTNGIQAIQDFNGQFQLKISRNVVIGS
jgi:hypothetical protein